MVKKQQQTCPCGTGKVYTNCCEPLHQGQAATTAEALMRSRYTAYVLGLADYLLASWHPSARPASLSLDSNTRWLGLKIKAQQQLNEQQATVSFVARYREGPRAQRLQETSRFIKEDKRWFYVDGDIV